MEAVESFGAWLKKRRRALDLTQQALADCAGCSLVTIRKFESDERRPSRQLAELLADCLAITAEEREKFIAFARQPELMVAGLAPPGPLQIPPLPAPATKSQIPPPRETVPQPTISLPAPLTGLIGRETDVVAVCEMLLRPSVRLVTLTGAGGTGKTRLAIETARRLAAGHPEAFPDGLFFVDLASLMDPGLFLPALAEVLGVVDSGEADPIIAVGAYLRTKRMLLVLDNFEQIVEAAADLAELLEAAGGVSALVTSRMVLRVYGEHEYPVAPLVLPVGEEPMTPQALLSFPAIALFVERSRAVRPGFALTAENAAAVREICARLDGLPLAIELAAAHSKIFTPSVLLSQLANSLDLAARHRNTSMRQQTMRGAVDWSYRLLSLEEQQLFRALSVFLNGFGVEEVRALVDVVGADDQLLLDRLSNLAEKSMIRQVDSAGEARFLILFVLREFAQEQLASEGETEHYRNAHLMYFLKLAEVLGEEVTTPNNQAIRSRLLAANDDLRAAMTWAFDSQGRIVAGMRIAVALANFWIHFGSLVEGQSWIHKGLLRLPSEERMLRAQALVVSGRLAYYQSKYSEGVAVGQEALALLKDMVGPEAIRWQIIAHRVIGNCSSNLGNFDEALRHQYGILDIYHRRGNSAGQAHTLQAIGVTSLDMGDYDTAAKQLAESIALLRTHGGDADGLVFSLNGLGVVELVRGEFERAQVMFEEALALACELETPVYQAMILANLGHLAIPRGRYVEARERFSAGQQLSREANSRQFLFQADLGLATLALLEDASPSSARPHLAACLAYVREQGRNVNLFLRMSDVLALYCARDQQPALAAHLLGRAEALRQESYRPPRYANVLPVYEQAMREIEGQLDSASRAEAFMEGAGMPEELLLQQVEDVGQPHTADT